MENLEERKTDVSAQQITHISRNVGGQQETPKIYSFPNEDKVSIRETFNRVGSERLISHNLGKAKNRIFENKKIPMWNHQFRWDGFM
ncbi:hypothetical protein RND71_008326 [Anisodus tanguticus]|uniref:Uncharacterized protein n=1 Tax=Anisodus tanguticus TaxID=243964 RepID=A0AAE1SN66_9SOLA|nr:hypothetical protein RND71_008326 [Anisodus tanguticus]